MSINRTRGTFIREKIMYQALWGSEGIFDRFSLLYSLVDFVDPSNGLLRDHPVTGQSYQEFARINPAAARIYADAEAQWTAYREKQRAEYRSKMGVKNHG